MENQIKYESQLVHEMWNRGWAAFRTGSSGSTIASNADVIGVKYGNVMILNVIVLDGASSSRKVYDENKDLVRIKRRAEPDLFSSGMSIKFGHAIKMLHLGGWYYADENTDKIYGSSEYKRLMEVIEE